MDYRAICIELFGTDDINELKKIAKKVKDNRNAGRKQKFNKKEIESIEKLLEDGMTMKAVADKFGTSRQIIDKYINRPPQKGYTMRMIYMYGPNPCTIIDVDFLNERIAIKNRTKDIMHRAFGVVEKPTWEQFEEFLTDRCFPKTRGNVKGILKDMQLDVYDPLRIVERTNGRTAEDNLWIKFKYYPQRREINANN
ncbi:MAG: helix-turn-helix domain-containing protein [Lachnospiraceae bacterium]|nr:helix-turn-helix domain-containing protein [Lachnospiraceae bacterium]